MTTHVRTQIRAAVVTALTSLATTGSNVFSSRMRPKQDGQLPCLLITTSTEQIQTGPQRRQQRSLLVVVEGHVKTSDDLDTDLDQIALEVETAAQTAGTLGGLLAGPLVLSAVNIDFEDTLNKPVGVIAMSFEANYFTTAGSPGAVI